MSSLNEHMKIEDLLEMIEKDAAFDQRFGQFQQQNFFVQDKTDEKAVIGKKKALFQVLLRHPLCLITSSVVFAAYHARYISRNELETYLYRFEKEGGEINIEYGFIVSFLNNYDSADSSLISILQKIQPVNLDRLFSNIQRLLNVKERKMATQYFNRFKMAHEFRLDDFDDSFIDSELERNKIIHNTFKNNTRMLGHLFSLEGNVPCGHSSLVSLTGSDFDKTAFFMSRLLTSYIKTLPRKQQYGEHIEAIKKIRDHILKAWRINELCSPGLPPVSQSLEAIILADIQSIGAEILTGWFDHGVILFLKENLLVRNNGGDCSTDATIEYYTITKPDAINEELIAKLIRNSRDESNKLFIQRDLHSLLGLKLIDKIQGKFQTVSNCSFESVRIALHSKYRIFLPPSVSDILFSDTIDYIENYYLNEYCENYKNNPFLAPVLMRLILASLLPKGKQQLAIQLIKKYLIHSDENKLIVYFELLLERRLQVYNQNTDRIDQLQSVVQTTFPPHLAQRLTWVQHFICNTITDEDWEGIETLSDDELIVQGYSLLHFTVMNNNLEATDKLLRIVPKLIHTVDWYNKSALYYAQSAIVAQLLISHGAAVDNDDVEGNVLDAAMIRNNLDVVKTLLIAGAVPSIDSSFYASKNPLILDELLQFHPDTIRIKDTNYDSMPHFVVQNGTVSMLDKIVRSGADLNARNANGITPLTRALIQGDKVKAQYLMANPCVFFKNSYRGDATFQSSIRCYSPSSRDKFQELFTQKEQDKRYYQNSFIHQEMMGNAIDSLINVLLLTDEQGVRGCLLTYPNIDVCEISAQYHISPLHVALLNLIGKQDADYRVRFNLLKDLLKTPGIHINTQNSGSGHILFTAIAMENPDVLDLLLQDPALQALATQYSSSSTKGDILEADEIIKSIQMHQQALTFSPTL